MVISNTPREARLGGRRRYSARGKAGDLLGEMRDGKELPGDFPFCPFCGAPLVEQPRTPALEERKVVSVFFCDLVGLTAASQRQD